MSNVARRDYEVRRSATAPGTDAFYMNRAIELAWRGAGRTRSNPMVGAVIVRDGRIVGEGFHERYGLEHAEVVALDHAGDEARGATLYSTLEPCSHHGKTPPCVDRIVAGGVERVVAATLDPDPRVNGRGIELLRSNGIDVGVGCSSAEALLLNVPYFKRVLGMGPAVTLKLAATLDGKIASAPGARDTITGTGTQEFVHRLRSAHQGVLVGIDTIITDRPRLDCRRLDGVDVPTPVVLDTRLRFPHPYRWFEDARPFIVVTGPGVDEAKSARLSRAGARVLSVTERATRVDVADALAALTREGIGSVLVEGGAAVLSSFVEAGMWDAMYVFVSPTVFGPDGVNLAVRSFTRDQLNGVLVGTAVIGGDAVLRFANNGTLEALLERLV